MFGYLLKIGASHECLQYVTMANKENINIFWLKRFYLRVWLYPLSYFQILTLTVGDVMGDLQVHEEASHEEVLGVG